MKYCSHCGQNISDETIICPFCKNSAQAQINNIIDMPSTGLNILAFLFPLLGLILYLVFRDNTPNRANSIGKFALTGFITGVVLIFASNFLVDLLYL